MVPSRQIFEPLALRRYENLEAPAPDARESEASEPPLMLKLVCES